MNKGQFTCCYLLCKKYVKYRISQKGNKIQEETNCEEGLFECDECTKVYCDKHSEQHMKSCKGSCGMRSVLIS